MKIVNVTTVVTTDSAGAPVEKQVVDQNFQEGLAYTIDELGSGLWRVTEVGPTSTAYSGKASTTTTRVTVVPQDEEGAVLPVVSKSGPKTGSKFGMGPSVKPIARPTQKTRHTPK